MEINATITDNGSNFVKAFDTFGMPDIGSAEPSTSMPADIKGDEKNKEGIVEY